MTIGSIVRVNHAGLRYAHEILGLSHTEQHMLITQRARVVSMDNDVAVVVFPMKDSHPYVFKFEELEVVKWFYT